MTRGSQVHLKASFFAVQDSVTWSNIRASTSTRLCDPGVWASKTLVRETELALLFHLLSPATLRCVETVALNMDKCNSLIRER
jgi:hypothetical protein